jgi:hypothetical protein
VTFFENWRFFLIGQFFMKFLIEKTSAAAFCRPKRVKKNSPPEGFCNFPHTLSISGSTRKGKVSGQDIFD